MATSCSVWQLLCTRTLILVLLPSNLQGLLSCMQLRFKDCSCYCNNLITACHLLLLVGLLDACWQGLSYPEDLPDEEAYTDADAVVADILTIARSPVFDSVHSRAARRSLADHLVEEAEHWEVPQTEEERLRVASAAFDEHRSAQRQLSCLSKITFILSIFIGTTHGCGRHTN